MLKQAYEKGWRDALEKFALMPARTLPNVSRGLLNVGKDPKTGTPAILGHGDIHPSREPVSWANPNPIGGTARAEPQTSLGVGSVIGKGHA